MSQWKQRLAVCRRNLGSRTGDFWRENRRDLEIGHEFPFEPDDPLNRLWRDQELLFTRGDAQVGALVMGNSHLFHRGWIGAPALIVHSADRAFEEDPEKLLEIASALDDLRNSSVPDEPELVSLHARLIDECNRDTWMPIPREIAGSAPCYVSAIFVHRAALPDGWLAGSMFPILALQAQTPALAVLPSRYWPEELVREWRERAPTGECPDRPIVEIKGYGWPVPAFVLGAVAVVKIPLEFATGSRAAMRDLDWPGPLAFALAGIAIFLFDRRDRAPAPPRYFAPICAHPIEVRFHRRFMFLEPRAWAYIVSGFAALGGIVAVLR